MRQDSIEFQKNHFSFVDEIFDFFHSLSFLIFQKETIEMFRNSISKMKNLFVFEKMMQFLNICEERLLDDEEQTNVDMDEETKSSE
jgi:hypothetical protein